MRSLLVSPRTFLLIPRCFLRANYHRLILTVSALAAGVALVCAIDLVNRSVIEAFEEIVDTMAGRAALQVSAGNGGLFPEETADTVNAVPGVELAVSAVGATAFVADGSGELLTVHGVDVTNDAAVRVYQARDPDRAGVKDPLAFLNQPDSVILTYEFAKRRRLRIGDPIELETPTGRHQFTIRGLLEPQGIARIHGGSLVVMDLFAAEAAFTQPGLINRIDVVVRRDADVTTVAERVGAVLPSGLRIAPPAQRKADLHKVMQSMQVVLRAVGLLGLAAAFLIAFNRLATVFDERAWQLGIMRATGVRAWSVWWELLKESLILGALGVAVGIPLGIGLGRLLLPIIATTTALSSKLTVPDATLVVRPSSLVVAAALGFATAVLAAARPAWRAARVNIAETIRGRGTEDVRIGGTTMWVVRSLALLSAIGMMTMQAAGGSPAWSLAATGAVLVTAALAARPLLHVVDIPMLHSVSQRNASGLFAVTGLARKPHRTALTIATLGVGFGTVIWIWIVAQSFEQSVIDASIGSLRGDIAVSSARVNDGFVEAPLDEAILSSLRHVAGVHTVIGEQMIDWHYAGGPVAISSFDPEYLSTGEFGRWTLIGESLPDVWEGFADGTMAIISSSLAFHLGTRVGENLTLDTPSGPLTVRVGGVLMTLISPRGAIIMSRALFKRYWHDTHVVHSLIRVDKSADVASVRASIARDLGTQHPLKILSLPELGQWFGEQVQRAFSGIYALAILILLVVLFGAADTLGAGVLERQRELAQLRATGVRARHVRRMVLIEAGLLGVLGLALAMAIGLTLGVFWVRETFPYMLGWVLDLHIPYGHLALISILSVMTCIVAAWLPAARAARLEPATGLRYE
ncbi:MAG: ABC transporter permease [Deltaproteobacteria bacterium]|nr:ABC transporter permease [Deltaproteobacteria bacterium]